MLDLINSTEKELLESVKKAIETGPITTQDKCDYYADELVKITKSINDKTGISKDSYRPVESAPIKVMKKSK